MQEILVEKGKVLRLAIFETVRKGEWHYGVTCKGCGHQVPISANPNGNVQGVAFVGEGEFSVASPCCGHDARYPTSMMKLMQATKTVLSFREKRPAPSGSGRQPITAKYRKAKPTFGIGALEQRPEAAQIIARCIAYWTNVEAEMARLLSVILKANSEPAIAVYLSLRNARAKKDALEAAASLTLSVVDLELFEAIMSIKTSVEKERDALAHGIFGFSAAIKEGVVWIDTTRYAQYQALAGFHGVTDELYAKHLANCYVYELGDLETVARNIEDLAGTISQYLGYLLADSDSWRAGRYPQLCELPLVQTELNRLRARQKKESNA